VRGLKPAPLIKGFAFTFAPITGAWIETCRGYNRFKETLSHPSRVRGLKRLILIAPNLIEHFAPITGAWIETVRIFITASIK